MPAAKSRIFAANKKQIYMITIGEKFPQFSKTAVVSLEKGKEFDKKYFAFKVDMGPDQKGYTKFGDSSPVEVGEYPIYYSDAQGSPVVFSVTYQLKGYFEMSPGNFVAPLKLSLNQN